MQRAECPIVVPKDATRVPERDSLRRLAGDYRLMQGSWQPAPTTVTRGHLHLEVPDSAWREVPCNFGKMRRDLIGWYRTTDRVADQWRAVTASRDPARPGVVLRGSTLRIGMHCVMDSGGDDLEITAVSPRGALLPNPTGFFCALREPSSAAPASPPSASPHPPAR